MKGQKAQKGTLKKVLHYIRPYWALVGLSVLLAAVTVAASLYIPILTGNAVDYIVGPGNVDFSGIFRILVEIGLVIAVAALSQWVMSLINNRITYRVVRDIRNKAFQKIQILPLKYLDGHPTGEVVSRVIADVDQFADGLLMGFTQLFSGVLTIVGTLVFMLSVNVVITAVVVVITPVSLVVAAFIAKRTYDMFRLQSQVRGEQTGFVEEMVQGQKVVQAFGRERDSLEKFDEINERLRKCSLRAIFFSSITNPSTRFVNSLVYTGVGIVGALSVIGGGLSVGQLSAFLSYANQYTKPFNEISGVVTELQNALACAGRVFELIEERPQVPDAPGARVLENAQGSVSIQDVAFSYRPEQPLLEDFHLEVKPGQRVALVGPTGCGKTTVINLLMRFYDVDSGSITLSGHNVRDFDRTELREGFGMVLQDTWLFKGTIMENIRYGRLDATDEEVIAAAKAANADHFIRTLPGGYQMELNEDASNVSQGQKQLLTIARAILADNRILILDEATSSVDTRTEQRIQTAMDNLMRGRTSFVIAHRLSTIRDADTILVMRDGDIVEQGRHEELLAKGGFYAELYNSQFEDVTA